MVGIWVDTDVKSLVGIGKEYPYLNVLSKSFMFRQKIPTNRNKIPALAKQYGCFAAKRINKGVTVGWYTGIVYTENNYKLYGKWEKEDFVITTHDSEKRAYVIEPFEDNMLLQWINDGKMNCTDDDLCNVKFEEAELFGIPLIKAITIKTINKNHQLFVDYGENYWKCRGKLQE